MIEVDCGIIGSNITSSFVIVELSQRVESYNDKSNHWT